MNVSDHSTVINFSDYHEGAAPALIINHTPWASLKYKQRYVKELSSIFWERCFAIGCIIFLIWIQLHFCLSITNLVFLFYPCSGLQEEMELKPRGMRLFAWADPTGIRKLTWVYAQNSGEHDLLKVFGVERKIGQVWTPWETISITINNAPQLKTVSVLLCIIGTFQYITTILFLL